MKPKKAGNAVQRSSRPTPILRKISLGLSILINLSGPLGEVIRLLLVLALIVLVCAPRAYADTICPSDIPRN
jgi:hypothetical protein